MTYKYNKNDLRVLPLKITIGSIRIKRNLSLISASKYGWSERNTYTHTQSLVE